MSRPRNVVVITTAYRALSKRFLAYLLRLGYVYTSSRSRYNYIMEFLHWLEQQGALDISQVTSQQISDYYAYISSRPSHKDGSTLDPNTTHSHLRNVRDLFMMLQKEGVIENNPCSTLKFPYGKTKKSRQILTQTEIQELYEVCDTAKERAILSLAYGCGLRVGEMVKCDIKDIRLREKILIVPHGKGNKRRVIPLCSRVAKDLGDYFYYERERLSKQRDYPKAGYAFMLNSMGGRMRQWTYNDELKKIIWRTKSQQIIKKKVTVHALRHAIASHLLEQGMDLHQVRMFLGHSQLETTQQYTHITQQQLNDLLK